MTNQSNDKKKNLFANKHYGAPLLSLYLQNKTEYFHSDISPHITATTWSNVLKKKLKQEGIIAYDGEVKGGKHEFKFDKDMFLHKLSKAFMGFCVERLAPEIKNKVRTINKEKGSRKREAVLSLYWRLQNVLLRSQESDTLRTKQSDLNLQLKNFSSETSKNSSYEDINPQEFALIKELSKVTKGLLSETKLAVKNKMRTNPKGKELPDLKRMYITEGIEDYKQKLASIRIIPIIAFMDMRIAEMARKINLNQKISLYTFFYGLIDEMARLYAGDKESIERIYGGEVNTICTWAYAYHMLGGKYELN